MFTLKDSLKSVASKAGDLASEDLSGMVHSARITAAPVERAARRFAMCKAVFGAAVMSLLGAVATVVFAGRSPMVGILLGLFTVGMLMALGQSIHRYRSMTALWRAWPVALAEEKTAAYRVALTDAQTQPIKWNGPMMGAWGTACLIGGIWALFTTSWFVGLFILIFAAGFAYSFRDTRRRVDFLRRGAELASQPPSGEADVVRGLRTRSAILGEKAGSDGGMGPDSHLVPERTELLWRCQISKSGTKGMTTVRGDGLTEERAPQDVMAITSHGIHLLNVMEPAQPWDGLGLGGISDAATAQVVADAYKGITSLKDFADLAGRKLDALAAEHGYKKIVDADPRNLIYPRSDIRYAGVYKRRFVPSFYFELELIDGTADKRDMMASDVERAKLATLLTELGYNTRPD